MPRLGPVTYNFSMPVACPSKYFFELFPIEPSCTSIVNGNFVMIADFIGDQWSGATDGMNAGIIYLGISGGVPTWNITAIQESCGGVSVAESLTCPPDPASIPFSPIASICCPIDSNGMVTVLLPAVDSTGEIVELAPCEGCFPNFSSQPVRYASGEVILKRDDLSVRGFGMPWGQSCAVATQQSVAETMGNGVSWQSEQAPFLTIIRSTKLATNKQILRVHLQGRGSATGISMTPNSSGTYDTKFNNVTQLLPGFTTLHGDGSVQSFDPTHGGFLQKTAANGAKATVTAVAPVGLYPVTVERTATSNGQTLTEQFQHGYTGNSGDELVSTTTITRQIGAGNPFNPTERVFYQYYGFQETFGMDEDLKTATKQFYSGGAWVNEGTTYYRYYLANATNGSSSSSSSSSSSGGGLTRWGPLAHLPKYVLGSAAVPTRIVPPALASLPRKRSTRRTRTRRKHSLQTMPIRSTRARVPCSYVPPRCQRFRPVRMGAAFPPCDWIISTRTAI